MTLYEDATYKLATQLAAGEIEALRKDAIEDLVVEMAKSLVRGDDGAYSVPLPAREKAKEQCPHCPKKRSNLGRHIERCHGARS